MQSTLNFLRPEIPSRSVLNILVCTLVVSLGCAFLSNFFTYFNLLPPQYYLGLSLDGMRHTYLWQFLTFLFVQEGGTDGITFGFLVGLFMNMAVLWYIGNTLCEISGGRSFYTFYFLCGLIGGCLGLLMMAFMEVGGILSGPAPSIFALLVAWAMLNPETEILLFFLVPIKAKWLVLGLFALTTLICFSQLDLVHLFFYLGGALSGYIYSIIAWDLRSPFLSLQPLDLAVRNVGARVRRLFNSKATTRTSKILDFQTGMAKDESDDHFMDRMLSKIGREGEKSLTRKERQRMQEISERKSKKK